MGPAVLKHLLERHFEVSVLTREPSTAKLPSGLELIKADYSSTEALTPSLLGKNFDAMIILLNRRLAAEKAATLEAAIAARIPHVIPSLFAFPVDNPDFENDAFMRPMYLGAQHFMQKAATGCFTHTTFHTGLFWEWQMDNDNVLKLYENGKPSFIFDGGEKPATYTHTDDIGRAIAVSLQKLDQTANKEFFIQSTALTQNKMLQIAREADPEREFPVIHVESSKIQDDNTVVTDQGEQTLSPYAAFTGRITYGMHLAYFNQENLSNELFGIEQWTEEKLKNEISRRVKSPDAYPRMF